MYSLYIFLFVYVFSHVVYNDTLKTFIISYLQFKPRPIDNHYNNTSTNTTFDNLVIYR